MDGAVRSRRALVTGDRGFIGRHIAAALEAAYWTVDGCDLVDGRDAVDLFRGGPGPRYQLVVHCAALVGGRHTIEQSPATLAARDLALDASLFEWALAARPARIVYFSSSAAYPLHLQTEGRQRRLTEADIAPHRPAEPDTSYGWVKLTGERLAAWVNAEAGIPVHVFRPFSGYGHDQALDYPFPSFIARAAQHETPFDVWGDGTQARDFIHVDDIAGAVLAAVDLDVRGPVNLGTGVATTFNDLAAMCMATAGYRAPIRHLTAEPVGAHWRVADPSAMHDFYVPKVTIEEGVVRALAAWERAA